MFPVEVFRSGRNPWEAFQSLHRDIDQAFGQMMGSGNGAGRLGAYPVDIYEDRDQLHVEAEMPGFTKDQINVTLEGGVLTISAERTPEARENQHISERRYCKVARQFTLPQTVDGTKVDAEFRDGVLYLTLHKREEVKPRKIEVK